MSIDLNAILADVNKMGKRFIHWPQVRDICSHCRSLVAEVERLRAALESIANEYGTPSTVSWMDKADHWRRIAREALEVKP